MHLVVGLFSLIGGLVLGLVLAAAFASRSDGTGSGFVNFIGLASRTVPTSVVAMFLVGFWLVTGDPPFDLFKSGPDIPPASSAREYTSYYLDGQIKAKGKRTEGRFGSHFGPHNAWYFNGQKAFERTYDEQEPFSKYWKNQWTEWHENGVKKAQRLTMPSDYEEVEGPYHDRVTQWYDNGQKYTEGDVKHGENGEYIINWLGPHKEWYASGQLKCEWLITNSGVKAWYENGKPLFENLDARYGSKGKFWDEQGNVSERYRPDDVCPKYEIDYLTGAHLVEDHPFDGTWKSDTELTLNYALANSDLSERDIRTIKKRTGKDVLEIKRHEVMVNYEYYSLPSQFSVVGKENDTFEIRYTYDIPTADSVHEHVLVSEDEFYIQLSDEDWLRHYARVGPMKRLYFSRVKNQ